MVILKLSMIKRLLWGGLPSEQVEITLDGHPELVEKIFFLVLKRLRVKEAL